MEFCCFYRLRVFSFAFRKFYVRVTVYLLGVVNGNIFICTVGVSEYQSIIKLFYSLLRLKFIFVCARVWAVYPCVRN